MRGDFGEVNRFWRGRYLARNNRFVIFAKLLRRN